MQVRLVDHICEMARDYPAEWAKTLIKDLGKAITVFDEPIAVSDNAKTFLTCYIEDNFEELDLANLMNLPKMISTF